jgi:uncharacterized membrane protein YdcZ (DUF606 family)
MKRAYSPIKWSPIICGWLAGFFVVLFIIGLFVDVKPYPEQNRAALIYFCVTGLLAVVFVILAVRAKRKKVEYTRT